MILAVEKREYPYLVQSTHQLQLIRHGEVHNPNHVVYGDLPGYHLSTRGVLQAHRTARRLGGSGVDVLLTSPLERAIETARAIADTNNVEPTIDTRLTESGQFPHWRGHRWDSITTLFTGELESYLSNADAAGGVETLAETAERVTDAINDSLSEGKKRIVVVSHQDPIQATRLTLTNRALSELRVDPPKHAEIITLSYTEDMEWREISRWSP